VNDISRRALGYIVPSLSYEEYCYFPMPGDERKVPFQIRVPLETAVEIA